MFLLPPSLPFSSLLLPTVLFFLTTAKMDTLYLSDVYAVSQGMSSQNSHTPITPRSPLVPVLSHGSASSSFSTLQPSTSTPTHTPRQLTNQKLKRRASTLSMSSVGSNCCFTLYALKSRPNSIGELFKVSFRCPNHEVAQTWQEQITHQMQSKLLLMYLLPLLLILYIYNMS